MSVRGKEQQWGTGTAKPEIARNHQLDLSFPSYMSKNKKKAFVPQLKAAQQRQGSLFWPQEKWNTFLRIGKFKGNVKYFDLSVWTSNRSTYHIISCQDKTIKYINCM